MKLLVSNFLAAALSVLLVNTVCAGVNQWTLTGAAPPGSSLTALIADPHTPSILYALSDGRVFKSTNGSAGWGTALIANVNSLVLNPLNSTTLYDGTSGGAARVLKSTDGGTTWTDLNVPTAEPFQWATVVIDPQPRLRSMQGSRRRAVFLAGFQLGTNYSEAPMAVQPGPRLKLRLPEHLSFFLRRRVPRTPLFATECMPRMAD